MSAVTELAPSTRSNSSTPSTPSTRARVSRRGRVAAAAAALLTTAGIGVATAAPASAAGPAYLPHYGASADFPTWFWGNTTLCVRNQGGGYGLARVASRTGAAAEHVYAPAYSTRCISRAWWGVPVQVTNVGGSPLQVYSY